MKINLKLKISDDDLYALGFLMQAARPVKLSDMLCHIDKVATANAESDDSASSDADKPAREQSSCDDKSVCDGTRTDTDLSCD